MRILRPIDYTNKERTYLITGCARSGTSILSGIMSINNIYMGDINEDGKYEDSNFRDHFGKVKRQGKETTLSNYLEVIQDRNNNYSEWGFKTHNLPHYFDNIVNNIKNPVLIITFRNPLDIAESASKYEGGIWKDQHLVSSISHNLLLLNLIKNNPNIPCILSSFEQIKNNPDKEINDLENFLGISFNLDIVNKFLSNKTYTHISI